MAGGWLRAMEKLGLVQIEGGETGAGNVDPELQKELDKIDRALGVDERKPRPRPAPAPAASSQPVPRAAPAKPAAPVGDIQEGKPFEAYYAEAALEASPYPAEKLLKVLDGLRQMDARTRKAAITAMDAADDTWSIADVVLDAQRKQRALEDAKVMLRSQADAVRAECEHTHGQFEEYKRKAQETIRQKIAELEQELGEELGNAIAEQEKLKSRSNAAQRAAAREAARLTAEGQRLGEITTTFIVERPAGG